MAENYFYSSLSGQEIENRLLGGVLFNTDQTLTSSQKAVARANIGAGESNSTFKVLGYFNTLEEMQAALQTLPKLGDAYGIGTESPYDVYVYAMHMVDGQAVPGWVNQGPIDTSAAAFDDEDISTRTGWTSSKIASELTNVQRRLVIDDVPTLGSGNPVASGGVAVKMEWKKIVSENVSVPVNRWTSSTKYDGYGFRAQIPIENVTADMIPEVIFDPADVSTGTFATIAESYNGGIYIYASEVPSAAITIPTIIVWRGDTGDGSDIPVIRVDPTLTVSGAAADAKAAGDAIRANTTAIDALQTTVDDKAGALVDTASGAIASFVPDATIPDLLGVTVAVEPVQDLHGHESPWPAGGGKNKLVLTASGIKALNKLTWTNNAATSEGITFTILEDAAGNVTGIRADGTASALAQIIVSKTNISQGIYYLSGEYYSSSAFIRGVFRDANNAAISIGGSVFTDLTAGEAYREVPSNVSYINIYININSGTTVNNVVFKPMLRVSTESSAYAPSSNICPISGWSAVGIGNSASNLIDASAVANGFLQPTNGVVYDNQNWNTTPFIAARGGDYTLSWESAVATYQGTICAYDKDQHYITGVNWSGGAYSHTFTLPFGTSYLRASWSVIVSGNPAARNNIRLNFGSADLGYTPFVSGNTYTITLGQTVYGGTLDVDAGTMTVEWGMYTYNGTEDGWNTYSAAQYGLPYFRNINFYQEWAGSVTPFETVVGDYYKSNTGELHAYQWIDGNSSTPGQYGLAIGYGLRAALNGLTPDDITLAQWKTWLASNPIQLLAKLKNPITIALDPVQIATITGQTNNVWSDAGDVDVTYAADIKAYIDRLNQPTEDDMIANTLIAANKYFTVNNRLFLSTASIAAGAQIIPGDNCTETSLAAALNALNA